jgi:hypothetical protein
MPILIRIDVDRPYGKVPVTRHVLSRVSSDFYFPRSPVFGYLQELRTMLQWLNEDGARAYVFFRRCTLPCAKTMKLLRAGKHEPGLHLENSRTYDTFNHELRIVANHFGTDLRVLSKHGSGGAKFGRNHYAPYEPEKIVSFARRSAMQLFLGNHEDPTLPPILNESGLSIFPSAFWLEPHWRDQQRFSTDWLLEYATRHPVVLLVHPENVLANPQLIHDFRNIVRTLRTVIL